MTIDQVLNEIAEIPNFQVGKRGGQGLILSAPRRSPRKLHVQPRRNRQAAEKFFRTLLKSQDCEPRRVVTDKLRSYSAAHRIALPSVIHDTSQYANN